MNNLKYFNKKLIMVMVLMGAFLVPGRTLHGAAQPEHRGKKRKRSTSINQEEQAMQDEQAIMQAGTRTKLAAAFAAISELHNQQQSAEPVVQQLDHAEDGAPLPEGVSKIAKIEAVVQEILENQCNYPSPLARLIAEYCVTWEDLVRDAIGLFCPLRKTINNKTLFRDYHITIDRANNCVIVGIYGGNPKRFSKPPRRRCGRMKKITESSRTEIFENCNRSVITFGEKWLEYTRIRHLQGLSGAWAIVTPSKVTVCQAGEKVQAQLYSGGTWRRTKNSALKRRACDVEYVLLNTQGANKYKHTDEDMNRLRATSNLNKFAYSHSRDGKKTPAAVAIIDVEAVTSLLQDMVEQRK